MPATELTPAQRRATMLFVAYLEHSYRYYEMDTPIISDARYDRLCQELLKALPDLKHRDRHLVDESALQAGTGYHLHIPWWIILVIRERERLPPTSLEPISVRYDLGF